MIGKLSTGDDALAQQAFDSLVRRYWPAVYAFIRRTGRSVHESLDLTQAFVADVLMDRKLIHGADRSRGRFRSLLLTAVGNFLREAHRRETRLKRSPREGHMLQLDAVSELASGAEGETPESAFQSAWCRTLVQTVLQRVREECRRDGLLKHWRVFEGRVVQPLLLGTQPVSFDALVRELGLQGPAQAANLQVTVKRRFAAALRAEVASTVGNPEEVDEELREFLRLVRR